MFCLPLVLSPGEADERGQSSRADDPATKWHATPYEIDNHVISLHRVLFKDVGTLVSWANLLIHHDDEG